MSILDALLGPTFRGQRQTIADLEETATQRAKQNGALQKTIARLRQEIADLESINRELRSVHDTFNLARFSIIEARKNIEDAKKIICGEEG